MRKIITAAFLMLFILCSMSNPVSAKQKLTKNQQQVADRIAKVAADNYEKYGCLPSVAVAQAFVESTLGDHKPNPGNLWGITISSGLKYYDSIEDGVYGYMRVINNGYYGSAPFTKDYSRQIRKILDGGYCVPEGSYYRDAIWAIETYGFDKYDKEMFDKIKEKERIKKEKEEKKRNIKIKKDIHKTIFHVLYDDTLKKYEMCIGSKQINTGSIILDSEIGNNYTNNAVSLNEYFNPVKKCNIDLKDNQIATGDLDIVGRYVYIDWLYYAVG